MPDHILIVGGGIGGLALAQGLQRRGISYTLFERDAVLDSRRQGYRIKIFGDLKAKLRGLLTDEAWHEFELTCAETHLGETTLNATDAGILASRRGRLPPGAPVPYTADRGLLRRAMMRGIGANVQFGKQFERYELRDGGVVVHFKDGSSASGTLLVGADGSRSRVRTQYLPDVSPVATDTYCIYGKSVLNSELLEQFPKQHRRWMTVVRDQTPILQTIISGEAPVVLVSEACHFKPDAPEVPPDYIHWGILFTKDALGMSHEAVLEALKDPPALSLDLTSEWHPSVRSLIELQDTSLASGMRIYQAPEGIGSWQPSAQVTVMGDAIHVISPAGGVGAAVALNDAAVLASLIADEGVSVASIAKYEGAMRGFAGVCMKRTNLAASTMLGLKS